MAPEAKPPRSHTTAKPYNRPTAAAPLPRWNGSLVRTVAAARPPAGSPLGRMEAILARERAVSRFDINAIEDDNHKVSLPQTAAELARYEPERADGDCSDCGLPVAAYGFAEYQMDKATARFKKSSTQCKACIKYSIMNWCYDFEEHSLNAPPCTCPPGSMACQEVGTGCALHVVPAMTLVPPGVKRIQRPKTRQEVRIELFERGQVQHAEFMDRWAEEGREWTMEQFEEAYKPITLAIELEEAFENTPLADFKMPPTPPPSGPPALITSSDRPPPAVLHPKSRRATL